MTILNADGSIIDAFQNFIALSRYARWLPAENRRETWTESVDRYVDYMTGHVKAKHDYDAGHLADGLRTAIREHEVMPSMRAMMTAGPALDRSNIAGYNCAFTPIDDIDSLWEVLYILLNGTGVGYSVERRYVGQLPAVPAEIDWHPGTTLFVGDSKEGWAHAYRMFLEAIWRRGEVPLVDLSGIRPAGSRLETFGGRASGPEPLRELLAYTAQVLTSAAGRKLRPIEVHDLVCKVASVVVVGGVRRAAMLALTDLDDQELATAKSGEWWVDNPQRALANISAVYDDGVTESQFRDEWANLVASGSGERGIFNRSAAQRQAAKYGRRDPDADYGCNPCLRYDTRLLTSDGLQKIGDLAQPGKTFMVYNGNGQYTPSFAWKTGTKQLYRLNLSNGQQIDLTDNHVIEVMERKYPSQDTFTKAVERTVGELAVGDKIRPFVAEQTWSGGTDVDEKLATAAGILFGDGYQHKASSGEIFISTREHEVLDHLSAIFSVEEAGRQGVYRVRGAATAIGTLGIVLDRLPERQLPEQLFTWSARSVRAFLRGLFSANGGAMPKHSRIDLKATNLEMLRGVQMLLSALGLNSYITTNKPQMIEWPNGTYESRESYDLNIAGADQYTRFQDEIGFLHAHKSLPCTGNAALIRQPRCVEVVSIETIGVEDVYDFNEAETHWGWANGIKVHNCSEILLKPRSFCNLSTVIVAPDDGFLSLQEKVVNATILGTFQATLTDYPLLRDEWRKNAEEERLLGVSLNGVYGNPLLYGPHRTEVLENLRETAQKVNAFYADELGIPRSHAITTVKPEGTTSQLAGVSSGIHPWHAEYYVRTIRADSKDPLARLMVDYGVPYEVDVSNPSNLVFSFPISAPEDAITRDDVTAIDHLELWLDYQQAWCDHKPSVTVNVRPQEWDKVGDWVWEHIGEVSGVAFLPYADHTYAQAPYQEITQAEYLEAKAAFPKVPWEHLPLYELVNSTNSAQTLACSASGCDVV